MEFCCEESAYYITEGYFKKKGYYVSGEKGITPSEKNHFYTEVLAFDEVESKTIKMTLSFCPFCGEKLG